MSESCEHRSTELRRKRGLFASVFVLQCLACGAKVGSPLHLGDIADPGGVPYWDARLARRAQPGSKKRDFQKRFKKADWKRLRARVLERDNWECRNCEEPATHVHHLTYVRFGEERMEDLVASCADCNLQERETRHLGR